MIQVNENKFIWFLLTGTEGPLCAYWTEEEAVICGHGSCYLIVREADDDV